MKNPLMAKFNNVNMVNDKQFDISTLRNAIKSQPSDFLDKMVNLAKQRGISQTDIDAGLRMLKGL